MPKTKRRYVIERLGTGQYNQAATRAVVLKAVAELEAAGQHVNGESVGQITGMRKPTAARYLAGLRKKGLVARASHRKPPERCNYTSVQAPDAEIAARLKILAARTKELDRRPTYDELCSWLPA